MVVLTEELQSLVDTEYRRELEDWILYALNEGTQDFWELVSMLPGAFPTDVRTALDRLVAHRKVPYDLSLKADVRECGRRADLEVPGLPTPHPLAFDWRFTRGTAEELLGKAVGASVPNGVIGLLGAPSVYFIAKEKHVSQPIKLLDQNPFLAECLPNADPGGAFHQCDITQPSVETDSISVIIADPPWYYEDALDFLRTASRLCAEQGTVLMSFAPEGSKPGVRRQRQDLIANAAEMGLKYDGLSTLVLSYVTPLFEHNALLASGFEHVPRVWRRGDLLFFRNVGGGFIENRVRGGHREDWKQFEVGGIGVWVRVDNNDDFENPCLQRIVAGDILPTVRRSDVRRKHADVWTCGNRIFRCLGRKVLSLVIKAMAIGEDPFRTVAAGLNCSLRVSERNLVRVAVRQIKNLVELEQRELGRL